jgi:signal transduction histidine kinase
MQITTAFIACVVVAIAGLVLLWANPYRLVNRAVFGCSLTIVLWLGYWHAASASRSLFFVKCTCAAGALVSLSYWFVKETLLASPDLLRWSWIRRHWGWLTVPILVAFVPFTESFIPAASTATNKLYGWGYYGYMWVNLGLYALLTLETFRTKTLAGERQLELQVWLGGGSAMFMAIFALMALSTITQNPVFRRLEPLVVLGCFGALAYAVTTHRIFDARQLSLVSLQKVILVILVAAVVYCVMPLLEAVMPGGFAFIGTIVFGLSAAHLLNQRLDRWLKFYPEANTARQATFSAAQRESRVDTLEKAFIAVLNGWGHTERAMILSGRKDTVSGQGITLLENDTILASLRHLLWVTPERLARERPSPSREALAKFLSTQRLGVLVISEGPALSIVVGVGVAASRRPYTYPQVTQLLELSSIMESALERAHFSAKAQHTEQLATVGLLGASLAHEIRNPLVSIKTFVQLLPTHHQDPKFREKFFRLIGDEVGRIDQLTEQLLDLAAPRSYEAKLIELHPLLRTSLDLVAAKAAHRDVRFVTEFDASPDAAYTDSSAAKQVLLNLCFNAIQAVESHEGADRWVKVCTRNTGNGIEMAVADSGPGVSAEIRPKLFQPFQTTKSTGFGLGLAICSDILANLNASISVDPPAPGCGATFRVTFPCQPLSS